MRLQVYEHGKPVSHVEPTRYEQLHPVTNFLHEVCHWMLLSCTMCNCSVTMLAAALKCHNLLKISKQKHCSAYTLRQCSVQTNLHAKTLCAAQ